MRRPPRSCITAALRFSVHACMNPRKRLQEASTSSSPATLVGCVVAGLMFSLCMWNRTIPCFRHGTHACVTCL